MEPQKHPTSQRRCSAAGAALRHAAGYGNQHWIIKKYNPQDLTMGCWNQKCICVHLWGFPHSSSNHVPRPGLKVQVGKRRAESAGNRRGWPFDFQSRSQNNWMVGNPCAWRGFETTWCSECKYGELTFMIFQLFNPKKGWIFHIHWKVVKMAKTASNGCPRVFTGMYGFLASMIWIQVALPRYNLYFDSHPEL